MSGEVQGWDWEEYGLNSTCLAYSKLLHDGGEVPYVRSRFRGGKLFAKSEMCFVFAWLMSVDWKDFLDSGRPLEKKSTIL